MEIADVAHVLWKAAQIGMGAFAGNITGLFVGGTGGILMGGVLGAGWDALVWG